MKTMCCVWWSWWQNQWCRFFFNHHHQGDIPERNASEAHLNENTVIGHSLNKDEKYPFWEISSLLVSMKLCKLRDSVGKEISLIISDLLRLTENIVLYPLDYEINKIAFWWEFTWYTTASPFSVASLYPEKPLYIPLLWPSSQTMWDVGVSIVRPTTHTWVWLL